MKTNVGLSRYHVGVFFLMLTAAQASFAQLSREEAEKMLRSAIVEKSNLTYANCPSVQLPWLPGGLAAAARAGLVNVGDAMLGIAVTADVTLTDKGKTGVLDFEVKATSAALHINNPGPRSESLDKITGITSVPGQSDAKAVEFSTTFPILKIGKRTRPVFGYLKDYRLGTAHFVKYDDGWRLRSVGLNFACDVYD